MELVLELSAVVLVDLSMIIVRLVYTDIILVLVYCSLDGDPNDFFDFLEGCLGYLIGLNLKLKLIFCGDFNIHLECPSREEGSFTNLFQSFGLFVACRQPTRGPACLDMVVAKLDSWDYSVTVVNPMVADHDGN